MKTMLRILQRFWKADAFSPEAFAVRAAIISVLYAGSRLAGLQEYTAYLSGTSANLNLSWQTAAGLGLVHLLLHVAFILLVPIFLITAGLLVAWNWWKTGREIPARPAEVVSNSVLNRRTTTSRSTSART